MNRIACSRCRAVKDENEFRPRPAKKNGRESHCIACDRKRHGAYNEKNRKVIAEKAVTAYWKDPAGYRQRSKDWRESNPEKAAATLKQTARVNRWHVALASQCARIARKKGLPPCDFDGEYLLTLFTEQGCRCHWLGIPMVPSIEARDPRRPSVDRIVTSLGYVKGNVVLSSMFANMGRSTLSAESFRKFIDELRASMKLA